jgi:uncharacterized protein YndB with AHSA1/START domain
MTEPTVIHSTFVIERNYPVPPERVFAAFADPASKRRWFVDGGRHTVEHYEMNFSVGGQERACIRLGKDTPLEGVACTNDTRYLDIQPGRRLVFVATMSLEAKCISAALGTVELLPSETGTQLIFTHQAAFFEGADGPAMREAGWGKLLDSLAGELTPTHG